MEILNKLADRFILTINAYGPKLAGAILFFIIGLYITGWITRMVNKTLIRKGLDISLQSFLTSLVSVCLKVLLLVTVAGMMGIQTTSFVAVLGAAGLAVGLALQGSLANFAGGVLILVFKPFKVGDLIESQGQFGEVREIQIFNTIILTPDNKTVILANGAVSNNTIINASRHGNLRVDLSVGIDPSTNIEKARAVISEVYENFDKILKDPAPTVSVLKMGDGMVTLAVRPYATPENYWDVYFSTQERIKTAFEKNSIAAPIPHRVIINKS